MFEYLTNFHGYGPNIMKGAVLTIELALLSLALALFLGLLGASCKLSHNPVSRGIATVYTTIVRGVPDLVLMMLIFYGGQMLFNLFGDWLIDNFEVEFYVDVDHFIAGVFSIGFIFGAYMTETFRGAFMAVDNGQIEAGKAYGMSRWQIFHRIMFPQMMRHALPGIGNNWQVLLKATALVSIIGLSDMVRLAYEGAKAMHEPFKFFIPVAVVYLALTWISELVIKWLEIRYNAGTSRG